MRKGHIMKTEFWRVSSSLSAIIVIIIITIIIKQNKIQTKCKGKNFTVCLLLQMNHIWFGFTNNGIWNCYVAECKVVKLALHIQACATTVFCKNDLKVLPQTHEVSQVRASRCVQIFMFIPIRWFFTWHTSFKFSTSLYLQFWNKRKYWALFPCLSDVYVCNFLAGLLFLKSFHSQVWHLALVHWRHYSYKWTFVLKECRACKRVGGWKGGSRPAVCPGPLFISIKNN